jgi:hypothetical protein
MSISDDVELAYKLPLELSLVLLILHTKGRYLLLQNIISKELGSQGPTISPRRFVTALGE